MKKQLLLVLGLMFSASIFAAPVTKDAAKKNVMSFLQSQNGGKVFANSSQTQAELQSVDYQVPGNAFYVFNFANKPGFVIASADDRVEPILGYSHKGSFDPQNLPDNMKSWLDSYAEQINTIKESNINLPKMSMSASSKVNYRHNIPAMLTCMWNQAEPYSDETPLYPGDSQHRPTGCVATAMAQIMYYHKWPKAQTSPIPSYNFEDLVVYGGNGYYKTVPALPATTFDWDNMTDTYNYNSTKESRKAVAVLMRYCGQAVQMGYMPDASGSLTFMIPKGLRDYLGYDKGVRYIDHEGFSQKEWEEIVYNELVNNRPVLYSGSTENSGGHQFVCDGYENEFFHMNWGWGGQSDGFFKLTSLNPNQSGVIGGNGMDFSSNQQIVIGVQPPVEGTVKPENHLRIGALRLTKDLEGNFTPDNLKRINVTMKAYFALNLEQDMNVTYGYGLYDKDNNLLELSYSKEEFFKSGYPQSFKIKQSKVTIGKINKEVLKKDGTYYLRPVMKNSKGEFQLMAGSDKFYMELKVAGSKFKGTVYPTPNISIKDVAIDGTLYTETVSKIQATVENNGDDFDGFAYLTMDDKLESSVYIMLSLNKGETKKISLPFNTLADIVGTHKFGISINGICNSSSVSAEVKKANTASASLEMSLTQDVTSEGNFFDIPVQITNKSSNNPYASYVIATLYQKMSATYKVLASDEIPVEIAAGGKADVNVHFDDLDFNKIYYIGFSYYADDNVQYYGGIDANKIPQKVFRFLTPDAISYYDSEGGLKYNIINEGETFQIPASACYVNVPKTITGRKFLMNTNPNCLLNIRQGVSSPDFPDYNRISSGYCHTIHLTDASEYYSAESLVATNVDLKVNVDNEIISLCLPFEPAKVMCEGNELTMAHSVLELESADYAILPLVAEEPDKIYCDFDNSLPMTVPSLLVVSKKYVGKTLVFSAKNVTVDLTQNKLKGEYFNLNTANKNAVIEGSYGFGISAFSTSLNTVSPFRLYLTPVGNTDVKNVKVVYPEGMTTGIADVDADVAGKMVNVYSVDGVKVRTVKYGRNMLDGLPSGLYIVDGKKFVK